MYLFDEKGKRYLDCYNNVASVGHCHPHVLQSVTAQLATLNTHTRYVHPSIVTLSERLILTLNRPLTKCFFTCSGSEANDLAYRLARSYALHRESCREREAGAGAGAGVGIEMIDRSRDSSMVGVICSQYAYHGGTHATAAFTPCYLLPPPTPSPSLSSSLPSHIETVDFISLMQSQPPATSDDSPKECDAVVKAISALMDRNIIPAMLILDCGLTSDGVHPITSSLLRSIMYTCKKRDILFVADEVQVGFARAGGDVSIWGFETILKRTEREKQEGLYVPDIVTMGKPMANGFPMGAIVTQDHISELFSERQKYFNTFGGNPVAARACHAVLDVIEMEHLRDSARTTGAHLHFSFLSLQEEFPQWILSVRSIGLMLGVRVVDKSAASFLVMDLKERGFLVSVSGIKEDTLKIRPPLCMTRDEGVSLVNGLRESIQALVTSRSVS